MAVLHGWKFCPRCRASLSHAGPALACSECGLHVYPNQAVAASTLVERDGKVLLARRAHEPERGKWDLVGGFLEEGEEPEAAALREVREETGLEVGGLELFGVWTDWYGDAPDARWVVDVVYRAAAGPGDAVAADDVAELRWFAPAELPSVAEFGFGHPGVVAHLWGRQHP